MTAFCAFETLEGCLKSASRGHADGGRGRLSWAVTAPTAAASGTTGARASCHSIASALNATNDIEIPVFANETSRQAPLIAEFDLGKGASGAAVQNLMLTLGR